MLQIERPAGSAPLLVQLPLRDGHSLQLKRVAFEVGKARFLTTATRVGHFLTTSFILRKGMQKIKISATRVWHNKETAQTCMACAVRVSDWASEPSFVQRLGKKSDWVSPRSKGWVRHLLVFLIETYTIFWRSTACRKPENIRLSNIPRCSCWAPCIFLDVVTCERQWKNMTWCDLVSAEQGTRLDCTLAPCMFTRLFGSHVVGFFWFTQKPQSMKLCCCGWAAGVTSHRNSRFVVTCEEIGPLQIACLKYLRMRTELLVS